MATAVSSPSRGSHRVGVSTDGCYYGADTCPKIEDCYRDIGKMEKDIIRINTRMEKNTYLLYVMVGIMTAQLGFSFI